MPIPHDSERDLLARVRCAHGYWFMIYDKCPVAEEEDVKLPELTRREKRRLKKGKL